MPIRILLVLAFCLAAVPSSAQQVRVVLFDEDDQAGAGFRDASWGFVQGGDELELINGSKLPVESAHAFSGTTSGRLTFRHTTGDWGLFIARERWEPADLTGLDSLILHFNGPAAIPAGELPRLGLESNNDNAKSPLVALSAYLPGGLDADAETWQRVAVAFEAFEPFGSFTLEQFKTIRFTAGAANAATRVLWVDRIEAVGEAGSVDPVAAPEGTVTRAGDRSVVLHWDANAEDNLAGYHVYRSESAAGPFTLRTEAALGTNHYTDFDVENGTAYYYRVHALNNVGLESDASGVVEATPRVLDDEAFLDLVQQLAIDYFWYEANPENGLVRDRSRPGSSSSIAAVGFGLSALTVAVDRGWLTREAARERVLTTLRTFWEGPQGTATSGTIGYKGFFYHFLNMDTATRRGTSELSTIDTPLLLGGVMHAGMYFDQSGAEEAEIRALADSIYERVEWPWAQVRGASIALGWRPESGFIGFDWRGYNEAMILYIQALGSPTHPVNADAWSAWTSGYSGDWQTQYGYSFLTFPPLFGHQYSHVWIDFRDIQDAYMRTQVSDYHENSRRATLAQRAYAIANPQGHAAYGQNMWGFTASDGPEGYRARGAPPAQNDNGTIVPTAPGGSYAFTPNESLAALRAMYDAYRTDLWGPYGFRDAFNPGQNWFGTDYLGIDQGPIVLMIENGRSERIWDVSMRHPALQAGLAKAGFRAVDTAREDEAALPSVPTLGANHPDPFVATTEIQYTLPGAGQVTLVVYDVLGRRVATVVDAIRPAGRHTAVFEAAGLPAGVYFYRLQSGAHTQTRSMILVR